DTSGGIGLSVTIPSFKLALVTTTSAKYTAFQLDDVAGSLVGIDDLVFRVSGLDLKLNVAKSVATGLDTPRRNWNGVTFGSAGAPTFTLSATDQLSLSADAQLSLFGFVVVAGHVTIDKTVANGNGLTDADALIVSLTDAHAFVGVGGGFDVHGTADDYSDDTVDPSGGIGISVTIPSFKLALVTTATAKYTAFQLDDASGSLVGIDDLVFRVSGLDLKLNSAKSGATGLRTTRQNTHGGTCATPAPRA